MFRHTLLGLVVFAASAVAQAPDKGQDVPPPTPKQLAALWTDLGRNDEDGSRDASKHVQTLIRSPKLALPLLKEKLKPVASPDAQRIAQCLAALDDGTFAERAKAEKELESFGVLAAPALEKRLADKLPLETQRRVEGLIAKLERNVLTADELRAVRAIEVLRAIGDAEALALLEKLGQGADGAVQTAEARKALGDLKRK